MQFGWLSLVPPLLVLSIAIGTKRVLPALIAGIITATLIATHLSPLQAIKMTLKHAYAQIADLSNIYTFGFLIILGALIALLERTGGTQAYARLVQKRFKTKKQAQMGSVALSLCFMIDDFFSSITVGSIMRPLTDKFHIAHVKLAYLIDALASPLVILVPVSSWIAMLSAQLEQSGISTNAQVNPLILADPFGTYIHSIPFIFYSIITFVSVLYIVQMNISYGSMREHEIIAATTGNLNGGKHELKEMSGPSHSNGTLMDFLFPFFSLFACVILSLLYLGGFHLMGGSNTLVQALQQTDIFLGLFLGGLSAFIVSVIFSLVRKTISVNALPRILNEGYQSMAASITVLVLAWTFGSLLRNELHTGAFLAQLVLQAFSVTLLPCLFFIITTFTCIAIGSSWGTIAIMVPLAIPMLVSITGLTAPVVPEAVPLLYPLIGAIFAGAVAGDHVSPIASTTLMSAASSGAYLSDHVHTQFMYAFPVLCATALSFLVSGLLAHQPLYVNMLCSLTTGIVAALSTLTILNKKNS